MAVLQKLLTRQQETTSETLRAERNKLGLRIVQLDQDREQLTRQLSADRLERAGLLEAREEEPGVDNYADVRRVEGRIASASRKIDELADRVTVLRNRAADLDLQIRNAEEREAPGKMLELAARHRQLVEGVRGNLAAAVGALQEIVSIEGEGLRLQREFKAPKAKTTPLGYLASDTASAVQQLLDKLPAPFDQVTPKSGAEQLRDIAERKAAEYAAFVNYGTRGPRYDGPVADSAVMVPNPRLVLSREMGTPFLGPEEVSESEAEQIRKEMAS